MSSYYLAGRYGRREELKGYAEQLQERGHEVTSRWLSGEHDTAADETATLEQQAMWAMDDIEDIGEANVLIAFTEKPDSGYSRGGRHVEVGYAIGTGMPVVVIGPAENVFYAYLHMTYTRFDTFADYLQWEDRMNNRVPNGTGEPTDA